MNNDHFPQVPSGGAGRLRALINDLKEDQDRLTNHPIYKEGYDDGYRMAQENYRRLTTAVAKVYNINEEL